MNVSSVSNTSAVSYMQRSQPQNTGYTFAAILAQTRNTQVTAATVSSDANPLSKLATSKPDFSGMNHREIVANINARYDPEIEKCGDNRQQITELVQSRAKELKESGIETAERVEIERQLYIEAKGYEGLSDNEIKAAILERYGYAENLTESEFRKMAQELKTAGIGDSALVLAMIVTPSTIKEHTAVIEMRLKGTYSDASLDIWRLGNPSGNEKINWQEYFARKLEDQIVRGADTGSINTVKKILSAISIEYADGGRYI